MIHHPRPTIRLAIPQDLPSIVLLIRCAVRELAGRDYRREQIESALRDYGAVADRRLIDDGTYYVAELDGRIVGAGGWSFRPAFGPTPDRDGDAGVGPVSRPRLNPVHDAARLRSFFVHPDFARRGIGRRLLAICEAAARQAGFSRIELASTRTAVPFYTAMGFAELGWLTVVLPDGVEYPVMRMAKTFPTPAIDSASVTSRALRHAGRATWSGSRTDRFFTPGL